MEGWIFSDVEGAFHPVCLVDGWKAASEERGQRRGESSGGMRGAALVFGEVLMEMGSAANIVASASVLEDVDPGHRGKWWVGWDSNPGPTP